jgi:hypothetical protein
MTARGDDGELTLEIDENGDVSTPSRAVRRRLAAAAGTWRVLPSAGDLMVLQRTRDGGTQAAVALAGEVDGPGALAGVLSFVHFSQWDGALSVVAGATRKTIFFQKGVVLSASSNVPEDRMGALLVRFGTITDEQLAAAVREVTPQRRLGTVLVERGLLTTADLYATVRRQVEEIFYSMLLVRRGAFYFVKQLDATQLASRLQLDTQSLLLEGLRRIDEMSWFRDKIPSSDVVPERRGGSPEGLDGQARAVFALVDGRRTLAEIAREGKLGEFAATKATFELLQTGHVALRDGDRVRRITIPDAALPADAAGAIVDAYAAAVGRLWAALAARGKLASLRGAVGAFLAGSVRFADVLRDVHIGDDGKLPRRQLLANVDGLPDGEKLATLQSALSELLMFALFLAGDAIAHEEEDALHAGVARALELLPRPTAP